MNRPAPRTVSARAAARALAASAVLVVLAGCGVGVDQARPLGPTESAPVASAVATDGRETTTVYLVRGDVLVPVRRVAEGDQTVESVLASLTAPLPPRDTRRGLRSLPAAADPADPLFTSAGEPAPGAPARVVANDAVRALPPDQQLLAIGQLVTSLDAAGYDAVTFVDGSGSALAVPVPGGRVIDRPVTREDYAPLQAAARTP